MAALAGAFGPPCAINIILGDAKSCKQVITSSA
eukprot:jgi/Mesen1/6864/ME000351S05984